MRDINIEALVLAAGLSSRMKTNKMLLRIGDKTVLQRTLDNILRSGVSGVTVVIGHMKDQITESIAGYEVTLVNNPRYAEGMGTSLSSGVRSIIEYKMCNAIMFFNGDMPFIKPAMINLIIDKYKESRAPVIFPIHEGKRGHPVLVDHSIFPDLLRLSGDIGAREVLQKYEKQAVFLNTNDPGIYQDIDDPDEYRQSLERYLNEN